jgi:uncharacterized protein (TIGR00297 family)
MQFIIGIILGVVIALAAYRAGALSRCGAAAAAATGGLIFGLGGWGFAALLLTFFISSSALSRLFKERKAALDEKFEKGSRRDWGQVLANGGLGALLAVAAAALPGELWPWAAMTGAMAAVNADTWGTELGVLSRSRPRLVTTWREVERGASGAISLTGSLAGLGGAALVGLMAALFSAAGLAPGRALAVGLAAVLGGLGGAAFDSLLGATLQAIYYCPQCRKETERHPVHSCGTATRRTRGLAWMGNDLVNFACSAAGALIAVAIAAAIAGLF